MKINSTKHFEYDLKKFFKKNPQYRKKVVKTLQLLSEDPNYPSLRLYKVGKGRFSISVDMKIRILITFDGENIVLHMIGNHDDVYN